ncbi:radical SAM protein [Methylocapsa sp. S129]|uniref:B12-binding domain-containing radical SAM protein n=1 Tax=Methylocapsa sp. S129 TaxID=1641869 RepID=UPI00131E2264|nr:radical SAM protein [Methylocapsa sp. S129]
MLSFLPSDAAAIKPARKKFLLYLVKPSHYDDDGYVIQWLRSAIPSNSLAVLYGIAADCNARRVLGDDVDIEAIAIDETNSRVRPHQIIRAIERNGGFGMVGLVGVQSNQFPRALDIARPLRAAGVQVGIGGFHVSGCLAMLPEMPDDMKEAQQLGISLFAGEAEGRLDIVLQDAARGALQPLYDFMKDLPGIEGAPLPLLPAARVSRTIGFVASFDAGRGCPFQCSFCTIINVQGRKSRYRTADDVEVLIRAYTAQGIRHFFITDDNLARNKNWESIFDRLIHLREVERLSFKFVIQVDTMCHKIANFVEKAARAGVKRVFIGLENINPESLVGAKKKQNRIADYREMLLAWKKARCFTYAGYILGFPTDTPESIVRDIKIIQRELPLDILEFFCLTPLPGSEDHKKLLLSGVPMDPDMNKYDLLHVTTGHPLMSKAEWERVYKLAWDTYYTPEHVATVLRRAQATRVSMSTMMYLLMWFSGSMALEGVHPLESGLVRRKVRRDRRPGFAIESPLTFYPKYVGELIAKHVKFARMYWKMYKLSRSIKRDPHARDYMDTALAPVAGSDLDLLEMFQVTEAARTVAAKARQRATAK